VKLRLPAAVDRQVQRRTRIGTVERVASRIAAAALSVIVICGGVRSGFGAPNRSCSSPLPYIDWMMSLPPTSSPFTYSCGIVGQLP